jgi:hypothetical protein
MKQPTGRFSALPIRLSTMIFFTLLAIHAVAAPFTTTLYNNWNQSTQVFATIPTAPGLTFSQIARGSGLTDPGAVTSGITSSGWFNQTSATAAAAANKYFYFTITANSSTQFNVTSILLSLQRSSSGPGNFQMEYSINGNPFAAYDAAFSSSVNGTFTRTLNGTITAAAGEYITFRLVAWNATGSSGTLRINNNTAVNGNTLVAGGTISTGIISGAPFCIGSTVGEATTVSYSATGSFASGNIFTAELSDASGSFASPVAIGTLTSSALSGTINAFIPAGTTTGTNYRIRVVSSSPTITGTDNGSNLSVIPGVGFSYSVSDVSCNGGTNGSIATTINEGVTPITYSWSNGGTASSVNGLSAGSY